MKSKKELRAELKAALDQVEALTTQVEAASEEETAEEKAARLQKELDAANKKLADAATFQPKSRTAEETAALKTKAKSLLQ